MIRGKCAVALAAAALTTGAASAERFDTTHLFAEGAWTVDLTYNVADDMTWCAADTVNRQGQWFSVVVYDAGGAAVFLGDPEWRLAKRAVRLRLDIDYSRWDIDAEAEDASVAFFLSDHDAAPTFLLELMQGSAAAAYNDAGDRLATFSLAGSHAAMTELMECWRRIDRSDPFTAASDPF